MKTSRYVVLGIAGVAGILLFFLVHSMMSGKTTRPAEASVQAPPPAQTVKVLIAAHDIKAGSRLADTDLQWQDWPVNTLNPAYIVDGPRPGTAAAGSEEAARKAGGVQAVAAVASDAARHALTPGAKETYIGGVA